MTTLAEMLAAIRPEILVEFSGLASQTTYNPTAMWLARICVRELNRRRDEPTAAIPQLELDDDALPFALEWLDSTADHFTDAGLTHSDASMLRFACVLHHLHRVLTARPSTLQ